MGSIDSVLLVLLVLVLAFGVAGSSRFFFGRPLRFDGCGAGVNSSSLSAFVWGVAWGVWLASSSESSNTGAFRRVADARVDFLGDAEDMFGAVESEG